MSELLSVAAVDPNEQESKSAYSQLLKALEPDHPLRTKPDQVAALVQQLTLKGIDLLQANAVPDVGGPVSETEVSDNGVPPSDAIRDNVAWIEDFCRMLSAQKEILEKNMSSQDHLSLGGTGLVQENARLRTQQDQLRHMVWTLLGLHRQPDGSVRRDVHALKEFSIQQIATLLQTSPEAVVASLRKMASIQSVDNAATPDSSISINTLHTLLQWPSMQSVVEKALPRGE